MAGLTIIVFYMLKVSCGQQSAKPISRDALLLFPNRSIAVRERKLAFRFLFISLIHTILIEK
jgi:hypothetical protein